MAVFWYCEVGEGACGTSGSVDGESSVDVFAVGMVCVVKKMEKTMEWVSGDLVRKLGAGRERGKSWFGLFVVMWMDI